MFLHWMKPGCCYEVRTEWGRELVRVTSVETDCVRVQGLVDGRPAVYRSAAILAYTEIAFAPCAADEENKKESEETAALEAKETTAARRIAPLPAFQPGERLTGKITTFFASSIPGIGNGYIELVEREEPQERTERVFFHIRQVMEKRLYAFLSALPRLPDYGGKPRGFRLHTPVEVTFEMADNRAHSQVNRPVAGAIRLTEEGLASILADAAPQYRFLCSGIAFVDGYRFAQDTDLRCSLTVQDGERTFMAVLDGEGIADLRLKRFLMESRPRVPDAVSLKVDLFRRWSNGRPFGPILAAHAIVAGEVPWSERDEMRWNDMLTDEDRAAFALVHENKHDPQYFAVQPLGATEQEAEEPALQEKQELSEFYEPLPVWQEEKL